jgi:hypothetical protein
MDDPPSVAAVIAHGHARNVSLVDDESFEYLSMCSSIDEAADDDMSIPSFVEEEDARIHVEHDLENDTTTTAEESFSIDYDMEDFYEMEGCDPAAMSTAETEEMRYNVTDITCHLCYFSVDGGEAIVLPNCGHSVCVSCFQHHVKSPESKYSSGCCPVGSSEECCKPLSRSLVKQIMVMEIPGEPHFMPKPSPAPSCYHRCPGLGCTNVVYWKEGYGPPIGDCFQCNQTSCLKCGVTPYHHNKSCVEYQDSMASLLRPTHVEPTLVIEERSDRNTIRCTL